MSAQQTPAGWYPDPWGGAAPRWWDGTQWTSHLQAEPAAPVAPEPAQPAANPYAAQPASNPYAAQPAAAAYGAQPGYAAAPPARMDEAAAARVPVYNLWIWLVVFAPAVSLVVLPFIRMPELPSSSELMSDSTMIQWQFELFLNPGFILMTVLGWAGLAVAIFAAYRDQKALTAAGVERPFSWFFVFLNLVVGPVYAIGRAVIVRRRTGRGFGVLWATIGVLVATWVIALTWSIVLVVDMVNQIMLLTSY